MNKKILAEFDVCCDGDECGDACEFLTMDITVNSKAIFDCELFVSTLNKRDGRPVRCARCKSGEESNTKVTAMLQIKQVSYRCTN